MGITESKNSILNQKTSLGIELGSTRIKAVLTDEHNRPIAQGSHEWENRLENGIWTYTEEDIHSGIQSCYLSLTEDIKRRYGIIPCSYGAIGISAMMHGYMAFDRNNTLLCPFRTWRNTITAEASEELTELFGFPVPQRWSIAHLYKEILEKSAHLEELAHLTTLAGYVHYMLTGERVLGIGEASGMFPVDSEKLCYNTDMVNKFDNAAKAHGFEKPILSLLPSVMTAGEQAGTLTESGARLLDPTGALKCGIPLCPPEGDAGTGMTATNSISPATGNVSAGTSVFAMVVTEKPLKKVHKEIDIVTTPSGETAAMVHCNNCTSELNAWAGLFGELLKLADSDIDTGSLYELLFKSAVNGEKDCSGMFACNYLSGEHVTGFDEGRPLFARTPESRLTLSTFMRTQLYTALGALASGLDILLKDEGVKVEKLTGHGGFFKTEGVGQSILAAAVNAPVSVMETAGEGGAWGMALLASFMLNKKQGQTLAEYLESQVFSCAKVNTVQPDKDDVIGFAEFMKRYSKCLAIEKAAVEALK